MVEEVHLSESVAAYAVSLVRATRNSPQLSLGASPRGSLALMKLARARAALHGRDFVKPDDVKQIAVPALAHRLTLSPSCGFSAPTLPRSSVRSSPVCRCPSPTTSRLEARAARRRLHRAGALGLLVGLAASEPAAVAFGAAFLLPIVYGLAAPRPVLPDSDIALSHERVLEGDAVEVRLELAARATVDWLELEFRVPARARLLEESSGWCSGSGRASAHAPLPNPIPALGRLPGRRAAAAARIASSRSGRARNGIRRASCASTPSSRGCDGS